MRIRFVFTIVDIFKTRDWHYVQFFKINGRSLLGYSRFKKLSSINDALFFDVLFCSIQVY